MRKLNETIAYLAAKAGSSIKYRIKRYVLNEELTSPEMASLQQDILSLDKVKKVLESQKDNGFLGYELHGGYFRGFDANLILLKRLGVALEHPKLQRAKNMLLGWSGSNDPFYRAGHIMDEYGRGGFKAVIANILLDFECDESAPQIQE